MTKKILVLVVSGVLLFATLVFTAPAFSTSTQNQAKSATPSGMIVTDAAVKNKTKKTLSRHQKHLLHLRKMRAEAASRAAHRKMYPTLHKAGPSTNKAYAKFYIKKKYGWGYDQYRCLVPLWHKESGWRYNSDNGDNGRTWGVPQAFPGYKMASEGSDWRTNTATQIRWGAKYIKSVYGNPCNAWGRWQDRAGSGSYGWY